MLLFGFRPERLEFRNAQPRFLQQAANFPTVVDGNAHPPRRTDHPAEIKCFFHSGHSFGIAAVLHVIDGQIGQGDGKLAVFVKGLIKRFRILKKAAGLRLSAALMCRHAVIRVKNGGAGIVAAPAVEDNCLVIIVK